MKVKFVLWILIVFMGAFTLLWGEAVVQQRSLADKTLRLHVVANSDSSEDQAQKLRMRDHLLGELHAITKDCNTLKEAETVIRENLPFLENSAREFLRTERSPYDVKLTLCEEDFSTRRYETFSLPAGEYHSLRMVIGRGDGKNWWCVVFPTLCNAASTKELETMAVMGGYDEEELAMIRHEEPKYVLQFKILEIMREVFR